MAGKARAGKIETTIELCRSERKWQKSIELADELKNSSPNHGKSFGLFIAMTQFLIFIDFLFLQNR